MSVQITVDKFLKLVERSGVVPGDQVQQLAEEFGEPGSPFDSSEKIADELVSRQVLTRWQANMLLQGKHRGFILGPYRVLGPLGRGGMGAVYLAEHQMMRRRCAIKVLPSNYDRESSVLDRFYREAQAVAALDHPNIVRAYDVNKCVQNKTEIHYLVMEYIKGRDLQKMVEEQGVLGYRQAAEFMRQAADGLAHAHQAGFVHRDVKPANLLVDRRGLVKILDLGLARYFDEAAQGSLTKELGETVLGTADYLSPEQALDSHDVDARADIYSLGQTFYFLLTGHPPFPEGTVAQRLLAHQMKAPEPITKTRPDAPPSLVAIIDKMTAKSPGSRFQTATEVADALKAWLEGHAQDSGFLRRAAQLAGRGTPSAASSAEPTHPTASGLDETELELAPIEEEEGPAPSGTKLASPAGDSGTTPAKAEAGPAEQTAGSPTGPADAGATEPKDATQDEYPIAGQDEYPIAPDLPDLEPLAAPSVEAVLDGQIPAGTETPLPRSPLSGSGPMPTLTKSGPQATLKRTGTQARKGKRAGRGTKAERGLLARIMDSPAFWIGVAALFVLALVIAILATRPESTTTSHVPPQPARPGAGGGEPAGPGGESSGAEQGRPAAEGTSPGRGRGEDSVRPAASPGEGPSEAAGRLTAPGEAAAGLRPPKPAGPETPRPSAEPAGRHGPSPQQAGRGQPPEPEGPRRPPGPERPSEPARPAQEAPPRRPDQLPAGQPAAPTELPQAQRQALLGKIDRLAIDYQLAETDLKVPREIVAGFGTIFAYELNEQGKRIDLRLDQKAPAILHLRLLADQEGRHISYELSGQLTYRRSESQEVELWEHRQDLGKFIGRINQNLVRPKVRDFFGQLARALKAARSER